MEPRFNRTLELKTAQNKKTTLKILCLMAFSSLGVRPPQTFRKYMQIYVNICISQHFQCKHLLH